MSSGCRAQGVKVTTTCDDWVYDTYDSMTDMDNFFLSSFFGVMARCRTRLVGDRLSFSHCQWSSVFRPGQLGATSGSLKKRRRRALVWC